MARVKPATRLLSGSASVFGSSTRTVIGSGTVAAQGAVVYGLVEPGETITGSGAVAAESAVLSSSGFPTRNGFGSLAAQGATVTGTGETSSSVTFPTPILDQDFESLSDGTEESTIVNSGSQSKRVDMPADSTTNYGFRLTSSEAVGIGEEFWYRAYVYVPSTMSFSSYGNNPPGDYSGWNKWMLMQSSSFGGRMYVQPPAPFRESFGDSGFEGNGIRIDSDLGLTANYQTGSIVIPRDEWFQLQVHWQLTSTGNHSIRLWVNTDYMGEVSGGSLASGYEIDEFGFGSYINGEYFAGTGGSTQSFYVDNIIVINEQPPNQDSGGRYYIAPGDYL